ncbi:uncharacterized protein ChaoS9_350 [Halobacterium phage ChaoS9]|uniref:Uncharacterized protein n=1 Tax=Halobacterium phage ChaoS9 TaxID=2847105 RepID=A0A481V9J2_9CAUD|nr:uncharacterized protein KMC41_gp71 [Halobacterium phage ChaoS9]QBI90075.1 uncharacterized protein ChaoS9_350 [Halobacterium phage ChaoS9]
MAEDSQADETSEETNNERVLVAARVPKEKKERIEAQLSYGDHIQDWVEDAIDRKLAAVEEAEEEGNPNLTAQTAD